MSLMRSSPSRGKKSLIDIYSDVLNSFLSFDARDPVVRPHQRDASLPSLSFSFVAFTPSSACAISVHCYTCFATPLGQVVERRSLLNPSVWVDFGWSILNLIGLL